MPTPTSVPNNSASFALSAAGSGGKSSDFKLGPGATFHYQHDVRRHADGTLTIFDNGAAVPGAPGVEPFSRPLRLALNMKTMTASLVGQYLPRLRG